MRFFFLILFLFFYSLVLKAECIKGDCNNGVGVFQFEDGNKYIGQFKNSNYDGKGTFRFKSGDVYIGQFKNGKYNGHGVYQFTNGSIYSGDYLEGRKNGFGTYTFNNGDKYEGEFKNGNYHGYGIFKFINGDSYDGEWSDGKYNGIGTFTYSNGQFNYGRFENNKLVEKETGSFESLVYFDGKYIKSGSRILWGDCSGNYSYANSKYFDQHQDYLLTELSEYTFESLYGANNYNVLDFNND